MDGIRRVSKAELAAIGLPGGWTREPFPRNDVPCNGCTACCKGQEVYLHPEHDKPQQYLTLPLRRGDGQLIHKLRHKPNGECIYLAKTGCTIHAHAPWACRQFDCRVWFQGVDVKDEFLDVDDPKGDIARAAMRKLGLVDAKTEP